MTVDRHSVLTTIDGSPVKINGRANYRPHHGVKTFLLFGSGRTGFVGIVIVQRGRVKLRFSSSVCLIAAYFTRGRLWATLDYDRDTELSFSAFSIAGLIFSAMISGGIGPR